jgi:hypothetical protein
LQSKLLLVCMSSVAEFFLPIFCGFAICCLLLFFRWEVSS